MIRCSPAWLLAAVALPLAGCAAPGARSTRAYLEGGDDPEAEAGAYYAEESAKDLDKIRQGLAQIVSYLEAHPERYLGDDQYDLRLYGMGISYKIIRGVRTVRVGGNGLDLIDYGCDGFQPGRDWLHGAKPGMPLTEYEAMGINARYADLVVAIVQQMQPEKSPVSRR